MTFLSLVCALLIDQARALAGANPVYAAFRRYVRIVERQFNAGRAGHGAIAWCVAAGPAVLTAGGVSLYLSHVGASLLLLAWNVAVLYLTMGFRQFSHGYGEVLDALRAGDLGRARTLLAAWRGASAETLSAGDIARVAIERGLGGAQRHVFGVIACFALLGAAGAVLYRQAAMLNDHWGARESPEDVAFGAFSRRAFEVIDWLPARLTAASFAVVGDFEDAVYCWRQQAGLWPVANQGVVLATGAGALGVRLGGPVGAEPALEIRPELGLGEEADADFMTSTVGLVWRAAVLWLAVILLVTLANWLG